MQKQKEQARREKERERETEKETKTPHNRQPTTQRHQPSSKKPTTRTNTCGGGDLSERAGDEVRVEKEVRGRDVHPGGP